MVFVAAWLIAAWVLGAVLFKTRLQPVRLPGGWGERDLLMARATPALSFGMRPRWQVKASDVLLPTALGTWLAATRMVDLDAIDDWGLFPALPVAYFVALGLLVLSIVLVLTDARLSPTRLGLHLVALVVVLHATVPLLFPEANYPWVYKHVGVVNYITLHGGLDTSVDIYHNWPGFFAVAAWFTEVAGVASPLAFAKWAPVYFNLLICLELAFIFRWLPVNRRVAWLGMFLFAGGNWVGQDYFAPQAMAFVLSLAVFGMVLALLRSDRPRALVRLAGRLAVRAVPVRWNRFSADGVGQGQGVVLSDEQGAPALSGWPRHAAMVMLFAVFAVLVVTHQLSPFLVLLAVGLLAQAGLVRPWWVIAGLGVLAIGYFVAHLGYLEEERHLLGSPLDGKGLLQVLSNPFDNAHSLKSDGTDPMTGRRITALGAPAIILGMWALAAVGAARRARAGKPVLLLGILAGAPLLLAFVQNYGGEAIFRIYLFSLPFAAVLAAAAVAPTASRWRLRSGLGAGVALSAVIVLFMSAFFGSLELYRVRPGAVAAMERFYAEAPAGSVLGVVAPNAPLKVGGRYDEFLVGSTPPVLSTVTELQHRRLGPQEVARLSDMYEESARETPGDVYLFLSDDQAVYTQVLGLFPEGSLDTLDQALSESPRWEVFLRNDDAVIWRFLSDRVAAQSAGGGGAP